jgi:hypothetical protein
VISRELASSFLSIALHVFKSVSRIASPEHRYIDSKSVTKSSRVTDTYKLPYTIHENIPYEVQKGGATGRSRERSTEQQGEEQGEAKNL